MHLCSKYIIKYIFLKEEINNEIVFSVINLCEKLIKLVYIIITVIIKRMGEILIIK